MNGKMLASISFAVSAFLPCAAVAGTAELEPGGVLSLHGPGVRFSPHLADANWTACPVACQWTPDPDGAVRFSIKEKGGGAVVADGRAAARREGGKVRVRWEFDVRRDFASNAFLVLADFPAAAYAGATARLDGRAVPVPAEASERGWLGGAPCRTVRVSGGKGESVAVEFPSAVHVGVQDNRAWGASTVSLRVSAGANGLKAGERRVVECLVSCDGGISELAKGGLTIEANGDWVPFGDTTEIVPGSALDFSKLGWIDAPAGRHGRVVRRGAHFEFEWKPGVPQRFYGVNLCFQANYMDADTADALCGRLARLGYNALRIHHHERELCEESDGTAIRPGQMAKLDNLLNACIRHGLYLTTDLFVSRPVTYRACGIDRDGTVPMGDFKEMVPFHDGACANYLAFARAFLTHVNPATGRRWADEPALAFLALVNEGNLGNYGYGFLERLPEAMAAWRAWLARERAKNPAAFEGVTDAVPKNPWANGRQEAAFALFLSDVETDFARRMRRFLREEIGCRALISDMSCWLNPIAYQLTRREYDYVDDHFYVDHPRFLEKDWRLPSRCPNENPARGRDAGFQGVACHRLLDRPFTVTEFNFSGPGQYRGVGGIMLGAQAALQDYDGIWRFAWSHSKAVLEPRPIGYFDVAGDPLQRLTERAVLALYLRRDLKPFDRTFALVYPEEEIRGDFGKGPQANFRHLWFGWHAKLGTAIGKGRPAGVTDALEYPATLSADEAHFRRLAGGRKPGDGRILIDRDRGVFGVDTPGTQGFFTEGGASRTASLEATVSGAPAAVWASALDGREVSASRRLLLTHVTDVQDVGTVYGDRKKTILLKWGRLPHLMRRGRADVTLTFADARPCKVHALNMDGSRRAEIPATVDGRRLSFTADTARDPADATCLYEIVR